MKAEYPGGKGIWIKGRKIMLCKPWMKALTVLLCIVLFAAALCSVVILDIRLTTSEANIRRVVRAALSAPAERRDQRFLPAVRLPAGKHMMLPGSDVSAESESELVEWISRILEENYGGQVNVDAEQIRAFLEQSTVQEYLCDKVAGYTADLINGTEEASITDEELQTLIEENTELIEEELGVPITGEVFEYVTEFVAEQDVDTLIREQVIENVRSAALTEDVTVADVLDTVRTATSAGVLAAVLALCLVLCVGIFFTTARRIPATLRSIGIPILVLGILLALPTAGVQLLIGSFLSGMAGELAGAAVSATAAVHYTVLGLGIVLLVAAAIVNNVSKKKPRPSAAGAK